MTRRSALGCVALLLFTGACDSAAVSDRAPSETDAGHRPARERPDAGAIADSGAEQGVQDEADTPTGPGCDCPGGGACDESGECEAAADCAPGEVVGCHEGMLLRCDVGGTPTHTELCPAGEGCLDAACQPIQPNVLLLVDTSSSMNWTPEGTQPGECRSGCWPWLYPACDNAPSGPMTRLGRVKEALVAILETEAATDLQLALQRFPQNIYTALPPDCEGGYWTGNSSIRGDEDYHALSRSWLNQTLEEIVVVPFPRQGGTDLAALAQWFDNEEQLVATEMTCSVNGECGLAPCLNGRCMAFENPELWGMGLTPFGKSLFYAGEYMRHFVVVEGRACQTTDDCGSAHYTCVEGACRDPFRDCRPNVVIAFTDGAETEHFYTDDFFHPRVQAKRLHYGLGCESGADCLDGASCVDGVCRPPVGTIDEEQLVCDADDTACDSNGDCSGFRCLPARLDFADPAGEDHIADPEGNPISLTIHVVDASNVPGANTLVAAYGGGRQFSVDLAHSEALFEVFEDLFGDAKELLADCTGE